MNAPISQLNIWQRRLLSIGVAALVATLFGLNFSPSVSSVSYLVCFIFWLGLALGCLNLAMIHHLTGGAWGNATRRIFEAGYMTLPVLALLFIPLLFGLHALYPWADPAIVAASEILRRKSAYENGFGFTARAIFYFAVWIQLAFLLRRWSLRQDNSTGPEFSLKARTLSGPGIVIVPFLATFAYVDWVMSIEPDWFSTIFAIILLAAGFLTALSLGIIVLLKLQPVLGHSITRKHLLDLGNLLLAFVMFWTYVAFSQLLISYSGNQPHEITWYLHRIAGSWRWLLIFIALFHFLVPFLVLLSRSNKENFRVLAGVAIAVFLVDAAQIFWTITPTYYPNGIRLHWTDFTAWLGFGGIWFGIFARNLQRYPILITDMVGSQPAGREVQNEE